MPVSSSQLPVPSQGQDWKLGTGGWRLLLMRITVRLHTILRRETPEGIVDRVELDLPQGASVAEAVAQLAIERRPRTMLLVVNGKIVTEDRLLAEGDELRLVPGVSGGSCQLSAISKGSLRADGVLLATGH
jgi:sulfur carrier protein ThiS